jgi:hypothetical protein
MNAIHELIESSYAVRIVLRSGGTREVIVRAFDRRGAAELAMIGERAISAEVVAGPADPGGCCDDD